MKKSEETGYHSSLIVLGIIIGLLVASISYSYNSSIHSTSYSKSNCENISYSRSLKTFTLIYDEPTNNLILNSSSSQTQNTSYPTYIDCHLNSCDILENITYEHCDLVGK